MPMPGPHQPPPQPPRQPPCQRTSVVALGAAAFTAAVLVGTEAANDGVVAASASVPARPSATTFLRFIMVHPFFLRPGQAPSSLAGATRAITSSWGAGSGVNRLKSRIV